MSATQQLANYDHPLVQETAQRLTENETTVRGKLEKLFYYTRDDIKFGFLGSLAHSGTKLHELCDAGRFGQKHVSAKYTFSSRKLRVLVEKFAPK